MSDERVEPRIERCLSVGRSSELAQNNAHGSRQEQRGVFAIDLLTDPQSERRLRARHQHRRDCLQFDRIRAAKHATHALEPRLCETPLKIDDDHVDFLIEEYSPEEQPRTRAAGLNAVAQRMNIRLDDRVEVFRLFKRGLEGVIDGHAELFEQRDKNRLPTRKKPVHDGTRNAGAIRDLRDTDRLHPLFKE